MSQHPRQGQTKEHREGLCGPPKQTHFPKALSRTTHPSTSSISLGLDCHWGWRGKVVPSQEESQRRQERCHSLGRGAPTTSGRTHASGTGAELRAGTCWCRHGSELPAAAIGRRPPPPEGAGRGRPEPRPLSPTAGAQPRWDTLPPGKPESSLTCHSLIMCLAISRPSGQEDQAGTCPDGTPGGQTRARKLRTGTPAQPPPR